MRSSDTYLPLSVVVPCYNAADTIGAQLEALAGQQWSRPWEVIVVDNRSTDASMTVIERYTGCVPHFRVVAASARQGQPYALNVGIAASTAEAVAICDADDVVAPGWVAAIGDALSTCDFVAGRMETQLLNPEWVYASIGNHPQLVGLQMSAYPPHLPHAGSGNLGIKRSVHDRIGGFNEEFPYLLDTEYCFRVQLSGVKLHYVPQAVVHLRYRPTLTGIYAQTRRWAQYEMRLFSQYRNGDERELWRWRAYAQIWMRVMMKVPRLLCSRKGRALLAWRLGRQIGTLRGSLLYRCPPVVG
jgi:glycosyltransferase involved in cell wall biosynthesis